MTTDTVQRRNITPTLKPIHGLTEMQSKFVRALIGQNVSKKDAAILAGYSEESAKMAVSELLRDPRIQRAIEQEIAATINTDGASIAWATMRELMQDRGISPMVRFQAAKWTLQVAGHVEKEPVKAAGLPEKPLNEYSAAELEQFLAITKSASAAVANELRTIDAPVSAQLPDDSL